MTTSNGDYEYMRPVSGFGWPQGYPEPVDKEYASFRRLRGTAEWESMPKEDKNA